jgi:mRNA-degrading endonuclease RelE of RelBE toxin-antitoxin system
MRENLFSVVFSPAAVRDVERLETFAAVQLIKDIKSYLEVRPIPIGKSRIKKIAGFDPPLYRIRSGDFRAYYRTRERAVVILAVTARKNSERRLKRIAEEASS